MGNASNHSTQILVVDRDQKAGLSIRDALLGQGFQCHLEFNAAGALTNSRQQMPALMIVDAELDACSGFDFARTVNGEYPGQDIPVIFISEVRGIDLLTASRDAGGIYFLSKPIDPSVLLELVNTALWMPHLIRRHIDSVAHAAIPKPRRVTSDKGSIRVKSFN
jgi:DNA-binding response OmpR family regulator